MINYDLPTDSTEYVHRIGRTGRIGNKGRSTSFYDTERDEKLARHLVRFLSEVSQFHFLLYLMTSCFSGFTEKHSKRTPIYQQRPIYWKTNAISVIRNIYWWLRVYNKHRRQCYSKEKKKFPRPPLSFCKCYFECTLKNVMKASLTPQNSFQSILKGCKKCWIKFLGPPFLV